MAKAKKAKAKAAKATPTASFALRKMNGATRWRKVNAGKRVKRGNPVFGFRVDAAVLKAFVRMHKGSEGAIEATREFMYKRTGIDPTAGE